MSARQSDPEAAERVLGRQWKHLAQRAGTIFAGTVLSSTAAARGRPNGWKAGVEASFVEVRFRVDRAIAGVNAGQVLTIREWAGTLSRQRSLHPGDRVLLFLYPVSRLGLTSPVGGAQGQIRLDASGQHVAELALESRTDQDTDGLGWARESRATTGRTTSVRALSGQSLSARPVSVAELARAIRGARGE